MLLSDLLADRCPSARIVGDPQTDIAGLAVDSRQVRVGDLFAALDGTRADGSRYIPYALAKGAVAVLGAPKIEVRGLGVPLVLDENPRRCLALMAATFFGGQPATIAAVTGTNGKTSVAHYTRSLWQKLGHPAASLGTLGLEIEGVAPEPGLTTPEPITLHRQLKALAERGIDHLALEASSHGLAQYRLDGVRVRAAAFTHISRDHYDYHGSYEAYFAAKRRLFDNVMGAGGTAVLNADVPEFEALRSVAAEREIEVIDYGRKGARLRLQEVTAHETGLTIEGAFDGSLWRLETALIGAFQAHNLLAAIGLVMATGAEFDVVLAHASGLQAPRGRMEVVAAHASGGTCIVDYAHTPDALASALQSLRPHARGRLHVVFGCGGDRDPGKRPLMGAAASAHADRVFLTDDNPRSEDPAVIRAQARTGCPDAREIGDRREAIATAYAGLAAGDVLLVAGKGHETGQIIGDRVVPFDDASVLRELARGRS